MRRGALYRRINAMHANRSQGCPECQLPMKVAIVFDDEPAPNGICLSCGRPYPGLRVVRIVQVDRGPR